MHRLIPVIGLALLPHVAGAQSAAEIRFAKRVLDTLQPLSFQGNREYCGYLAYNAAGKLVATAAHPGKESECLPTEPDPALNVFASYHTHGKFDLDVPAEFPSVGDIEADEAEGIDGFVATPGGRLWYVDTEDMQVRQICSIGCLKQDPGFKPGLDGKIEQVYSYEDLLALEAG